MALFLIIFFGLILRLVNLNQSLWLDEATTALVSKMSLQNIFTKFLPGDFHPPFYYIVLKFWTALFGYSEISLRLPSIIFGLATVFVVYGISKKMFDLKTAYTASFLTATSGLLVYYSQEARMYSMIVFLVSLLVYFFINKSWLFFSLTLAAVGLTDYVALLILPVFWISFIINKNRQELLKFAQSHLLFVVTFLIWTPTFVKQFVGGLGVIDTPWGGLLGPSNVKNILLIPVKFVLGRISFDNKIIYGLIVSFTLLIAVYLMVRVYKINRLVWMWLVLPIFIGILLSFKIPTLSYFRFIFCLPPLYIIIAKSLTTLKSQNRIYLLIVFATINIVSSFYYLLNPKFHREDWRSAVGFVEKNKTSDGYIVFVTRSNWEGYQYYAPDAKIVQFNALPEKLASELWLVRYVWNIFDPEDSARVTIEKLGYNKETEYNFNGVDVFKYVLK